MTPSESLPTVLSAGEALIDLVRVGERDWQSHPGGAGWNVARACASLGLASAFAGAVGTDVFGEEVAHATRESGLDGRFLQRVAQPTLLAVVHETRPPAYFFLGENSADLHFDSTALPGGWQAAARWIHLGGISLARPPLNATLLRLAEDARASGARISFDPNARVTHRDPAYRLVMERVLAMADLVKFSDEDLRFFFPDQPEEDALAWIRRHAPDAPVVITRGGEGVTLFHEQRRVDLPAHPVRVVDTVGAGDAFVAGLLYGAVARPGAAWEEHVTFATRVAAVACTHAGAHAPTLAEVNALGRSATGGLS